MQDKEKIVEAFFKQNDFDYISKTININYSIKDIKALYGKKKKLILTVNIAVYFLPDIASIDQLETAAKFMAEKEKDSLCLAICSSDLYLDEEHCTYMSGENIIHFAYVNEEHNSVMFDFDIHYLQSKYIKELVRFMETALNTP